MIAEAQDVAVRAAPLRWHGARSVLTDYLSLTKPRILLLLLMTELGAMISAARGWPGTSLTLAALAGGALSAGGAAAVNCWFDRDIDAVMARTCTRPVPSGRIQPGSALTFGVVLAALGCILLALATNLLAATLALAGGLFYIFVYTIWLKRATRQNIVIGGAAGAFPPLVGWAVVTGAITPPALALFAVIFFWTPPHFWSLALLLRRQYRAVGVPMLPVVASDLETRRSIVAYAVLLLAFSLVPGIWFGPWYTVGAAILSGAFLWMAVRGLTTEGVAWASRLFHFSLVYLGLVFVLAAGAAVLPH
ncbi:MAG TPA: heme o synthase [Candidatus Dormibacteraeota bacterium]|nr:heme o synthase [Candidatus Dormibacteraeota bacterium]